MSASRVVLCPLYQQAIELIGRRWNGAIIAILSAGPTRFSTLKAGIPELSDRMLSERLKELEEHGLISRTVLPQWPIKVDYALTDKGKALQPAIDAITTWAHTWLVPSAMGSTSSSERAG